jgi:hypothetical protein
MSHIKVGCTDFINEKRMKRTRKSVKQGKEKGKRGERKEETAREAKLGDGTRARKARLKPNSHPNSMI